MSFLSFFKRKRENVKLVQLKALITNHLTNIEPEITNVSQHPTLKQFTNGRKSAYNHVLRMIEKVEKQ